MSSCLGSDNISFHRFARRSHKRPRNDVHPSTDWSRSMHVNLITCHVTSETRSNRGQTPQYWLRMARR